MDPEKEEFKSRLVDEVFGQGVADNNVPMDKVTMLIWQFRDDERVVEFLAQFVSMYSGCRDVFDGIEFYLPQLAHMIIHLEANWDDAILERFALIICQHSLHFALQFHWILMGALEDYQPEMANGTRNPSYNALFYSRVVKLLSNMDRCVIIGTPQTNKLRTLYDKGKISEGEYQLLELADRKFQAARITSRSSSENISETEAINPEIKTDQVEGWLLYKRQNRVNCCRTKRWKQRYFIINDNMLYCYYESDQKELVRSMPLEGARVEEVKDGKYPCMFIIYNHEYFYQLRASTQPELEQWLQRLQLESFENLRIDKTLLDSTKSGLTRLQQARYDFYKGERDFVHDICQIAERLRFQDRSERKKLALEYVSDLQIPESAYLPLCKSTETWKRVVGVVAKESIVINTKERCPVFMYFVTKRGEKKMNSNLDVIEYLNLFLDQSNAQTPTAASDTFELQSSILSSKPKFTVQDETSVEVTHSNDDILSENSSSDVNKRPVWHERKISVKTLKLMPSTLVKKMDRKERRKLSKKQLSRYDISVYPLQSVKIVDGKKDDDSVLSLITEEEEEEIDADCIARAKDIICRGEMWSEKKIRLLQECIQQGIASQDDDSAVLEIGTVMVKSNDDLRQEVFVMQMIHFYKSVFIKEGLPILLHTYSILSTSKDTGLVEVNQNATSIDGLKKSEGYPETGGLLAYFEKVFGGKDSPSFKKAQRNFMLSLVGYSLVSYLLGLKDRHNGNIMIDIHGQLIFIDFGFAFGMAPGHEWSFERAPFKFTKEYMDVMGGEESSVYAEFKRLFVSGFEAARANSQIALGLVEIMMYKSNFPCFAGSRYGGGISLKKFEDRLMINVPQNEIERRALSLINQSYNHYGTTLYDKFQLMTNGYLP